MTLNVLKKILPQLEYACLHGHFKVPEPRYVPWTGKNCPLRPGDTIQSTRDKFCCMVETISLLENDVAVAIPRYGITSGLQLLGNYTFKGQPCGTLIEGE